MKCLRLNQQSCKREKQEPQKIIINLDNVIWEKMKKIGELTWISRLAISTQHDDIT